MKNTLELVKSIEKCYLPKLKRSYDYDAFENHTEFGLRQIILEQCYPTVIKLLGEINLRDCNETNKLVSYLFILYQELRCAGQWNTERCKELAKTLNSYFEVLYEVGLKNVLKQNEIFQPQLIMDNCLEALNLKLTPDHFTHYPSFIEVYCSIIKIEHDENIELNLAKTLSISLLLIYDNSNTYKIKGLQCCTFVLQRSLPKNFSEGNYYEVIYKSLKEVIFNKNVLVIKLALGCLQELLRLLPESSKMDKIDEIYTIVLEQLDMEANIYIKAAFFSFIKNLLKNYGFHCMKWKKFKYILVVNFDVSCNDTVAEILLQDVLECFEEWIKHCWCIWKFKTDHKILSTMLKLLYVCEEEKVQPIVKLIITLISLCDKEEQLKITENLQQSSKIQNVEYQKRVYIIKNQIEL